MRNLDLINPNNKTDNNMPVKLAAKSANSKSLFLANSCAISSKKLYVNSKAINLYLSKFG